jgi:mannose-6-phosphate isomerase-like protein (cupin superfamily)
LRDTGRVSEPNVVPRGAGELIADTPDRRVEVLAEHDAMHATWARFAPRRDGADLHVHRHHTDLFFVLEGELTLRLGPEGDEVPAPAGTLVRVPPLVVHGYRNGADANLAYLNCHAPGTGFADYLRALQSGAPHDFDQEPPPADGGRPPTEASLGGERLVVEGPHGGRVTLLADAEEIAWAEVEAPPGARPPPAHRHRRHAESLYVLEGGMAVTVGGRRLRVEPGSWLTIPAGVPHAYPAAGERPVRFLVLHTPNARFGAFVRALRGAGEGADDAAARAGFDLERVA